jgi:hypothetical protein
MARVPGSHYHLIAPVLDAGMMGIMVPMVENAEQAAGIAKWCRYRPQGVRGLAFGMAHDDYEAGPVPDKMATANERTLGRVLEGVDLGAGIAVELDLTPPAEAVIDAALASGLVLSPPASNLRVGRDPLGAMAIAGGGARRWSEDAPHFARRLAALAREGFAGPQAAADGRVIHNAGGSEMQELGYVEGKHFVIEYRSADGLDERFPELAADLARLRVDLIVTRGTHAILATKNATNTIPIVITGAHLRLSNADELTQVSAFMENPVGGSAWYKGMPMPLSCRTSSAASSSARRCWRTNLRSSDSLPGFGR